MPLTIFLKAPFRFTIRSLVAGSDEFKLVDSGQPQGEESQNVDYLHAEPKDDEDPLAQAIEGDGHSQPAKMKYYDDVGYRRTT